MQLADPNTTPLDLRFRLFGTDVRVHPLFWLVMAILGWGMSALLPGNGLADVAVWVLCGFFSILLHEFGHVWMGKVFGSRGQYIVLHSMGGLAFNADAPRGWQRVLISAAGPGIQLVLFAALVGLIAVGALPNPLDRANWAQADMGQLVLIVALRALLIMNLFWPLLNLLPVWPLDGGQITREVAQGIAPRQGVLISLWISLIVAALLAVNAFLVEFRRMELIPYVGRFLGGMFMGIFFVLFAIGSFQAIQAENYRRKRFWDDELPWER